MMAAPGAATQARERELRQRLRGRAQQHQQRGERAGRRHRLAFAEPVADQAGESCVRP